MDKLTKDDKWVLVSCLQKSVRKGFENLAGIYAQKLCELGERSYLAYRLSIMAVEDVGVAATDDIVPFLKTRIKKAEVDTNGGVEYLVETAKLFARAKKDRTACDLVTLAQGYKPTELSLDEHKAIFLDPNQHEITRALSAWSVLGAKKHKNSLIQDQEDRLSEFIELNAKLLENSQKKDIILGILEDSYPVHREPHFIVIGLLQAILEEEKDVGMSGFKTGDFVSRGFNQFLAQNYFLVDGIDTHTAQGKTAAYKFLKKPSLVNEWMEKNNVPFEARFNVVKCLSFRAIGQQVNHRMFYPTATRVMRDVQSETLNRYVGHEVDFKEALKSFNASVPIWNNCIEEVITKQYGEPKRPAGYFPF